MQRNSRQPSQRVWLHYADTLTGLLRDAIRSSNLSVLLLSLAGLFLIGVSFGAVSVGQSADLLGLRLRFPPWALYIGATWLVGTLWMYSLGLELYAQTLTHQILQIYDRLGYEEPKWDVRWKQLLSGPGFFSVTFAKNRFRRHAVSRLTQFISLILVLLIITLFPLFAQIVATVKLVSEYGAAWWAITFESLIILVSLGYAVTALGKLKEQNRRLSAFLEIDLDYSGVDGDSVSDAWPT